VAHISLFTSEGYEWGLGYPRPKGEVIEIEKLSPDACKK